MYWILRKQLQLRNASRQYITQRTKETSFGREMEPCWWNMPIEKIELPPMNTNTTGRRFSCNQVGEPTQVCFALRRKSTGGVSSHHLFIYIEGWLRYVRHLLTLFYLTDRTSNVSNCFPRTDGFELRETLNNRPSIAQRSISILFPHCHQWILERYLYR